MSNQYTSMVPIQPQHHRHEQSVNATLLLRTMDLLSNRSLTIGLLRRASDWSHLRHSHRHIHLVPHAPWNADLHKIMNGQTSVMESNVKKKRCVGFQGRINKCDGIECQGEMDGILMDSSRTGIRFGKFPENKNSPL